MTPEEHFNAGEFEDEPCSLTPQQNASRPQQAPVRRLYVKPVLNIRRSGRSFGQNFKIDKHTYPLALPMVVCFIYFLAMTLGGVNPLRDSAEVYLKWGRGEHDSIYGAGQWWRLVTNVFAHAGIEHFLSNLAAYAFGVMFLKQLMSPWKVLAVFLLCAFAGSVVCSIVTDYVFLGASGGVLGLFGTFIGCTVLQSDLLAQHKTSLYVSLIVVAVSILLSFQADVSLTAHLVGIITGVIIGFIVYSFKRRKAN